MNKSKKLLIVGIIISALFVIIGCIWLSLSAETLDEVAELFGASEFTLWTPPIPDYEIPGLEGNLAANITIGILFTLLILGITFAVGKALKVEK
jgi:hypothetical protein